MPREKKSLTPSYARENAQRRRNEETHWFSKLAEVMPFPTSAVAKLDKGKILRLAINYIRMKKYTRFENDQLLDNLRYGTRNGHSSIHERTRSLNESNLMLEALNGFLIFINRKGVVYYASEQVQHHLGVDQHDLIGKNIFELVHSDDQTELLRQTHEHPTCRGAVLRSMAPPAHKRQAFDWSRLEEEDEEEDLVDPTTYIRERLFSVRMKCHMVRKKGNVTKQAGYCLMQWRGRMKLERVRHGCCRVVGLVALCRPMNVPIMELRMQGNMFTSRHKLDMRFTHCDERIFHLIGYTPEEVIGKTAYQFHNPQDASKIYSCHSNLIHKGTSVSKYYRFLGKVGLWVWMQTRATVISNADGSRYIICMNFIIGEEEGRRCLMMEQEEKGCGVVGVGSKSIAPGNDDNAPAAIDITALNSPVSAHSSGYSSADDENLISPHTASQFSPFSPEMDDFAGLTFGDAGLADMSEAAMTPSLSRDAIKETGLVFPTLAMSPMHNPNFEELIDVDTYLDPLPSYGTVTSQSMDLTQQMAISTAAPVSMSDAQTNASLVATSNQSNATTMSTNSPPLTGALNTMVTSSASMNCHFDNDIEMMDTSDHNMDTTTVTSQNKPAMTSPVMTSAPGSSAPTPPPAEVSNASPNPHNLPRLGDTEPANTTAMSNITINLPPGFNPKGQDGKSVLLDVLRKADKSQLLKIHEQINAAMASISQSRSNGKSTPVPELQISITPAATSGSSVMKSPGQSHSASAPTSPVTQKHTSVVSGVHSAPAVALSSSPLLTMMSNPGVALSTSPQAKNKLSATKLNCDSFSEMTRASTPMDVAGTNVDNLSSLLADMDQQLLGFDMLGESSEFTDNLVNDVNLGVATTMSTPPSVSHVAKVNSNRVAMTSPCSNSIQTRLHNKPMVTTIKKTVTTTGVFKQPSPPPQNTKSLLSPIKRTTQQQNSLQSNDETFDLAAAVRGLDDHSYTSKCPSRRASAEHVRFAPPPSTRTRRNAPVLQHLLTTSKPLHPMKGSDHVAHGLQQLALRDSEGQGGLQQPNLLKKLLTGEMDKSSGGTGLQRSGHGGIYSRRNGGNYSVTGGSSGTSATAVNTHYRSTNNSVNSRLNINTNSTTSNQNQQQSPNHLHNTLTTTTPQRSAPQNIHSSSTNQSAGLGVEPDYGFDEAAMLGSLDLLGGEAGVEMCESLWSTTPKDSASGWNNSAKSDSDEIFGDINSLLQGETQSELDEILRQETRHEDEWMKQFLDGLL